MDQRRDSQSLTSAQLLDLRKLRAQAIVDPREHVMSTQVVSRHVGGVDVHGHRSHKHELVIKMQRRKRKSLRKFLQLNLLGEREEKDERINIELERCASRLPTNECKRCKIGQSAAVFVCVLRRKEMDFFFFAHFSSTFIPSRLHKYSERKIPELLDFFSVVRLIFGAYN
jgi:hypothetical protein